MTKTEIFDAFRGQISRTMISQVFDGCADNEFAIVGRYCRIVDREGAGWDVWLCNPRDPTAGLTPRKVTALIGRISDRLDPATAPHSPLAAAAQRGWHVLDGEAWTVRLSVDDILACLSILGVRRKKQMSDEQRDQASLRLAAARFGAVEQVFSP